MSTDRLAVVQDGLDRLQRFARITTEMLEAENVQEICAILTGHLTAAAGADGGSVSLLVGDTLVLSGLRGGARGASKRYARYPLDASTPAGDALRAGEPLILAGRDAITGRYPDLPLVGTGERSIVCLPMLSQGRPLGVATLSFADHRDMDAAEQTFFMMLADVCAHSLDRIAAVDAAKDREAKLNFLAAASARMMADIDYEATLRAVTEMAVPWFADWCTIALEEDGVLRTLSVAHGRPEHAEVVAELQRKYPPSPDPERGIYRVLRTGRSDLVPELDDDLLRLAAQDEDHLDLLRQLEFRSAMACPLAGRDRVLGVITWVTGADGRRFSEEDLAFGEDLAARAAVAIENAQLHERARRVSVHLTEAVLTHELPQLPEVRAAVAYRPSGRTDVGGDFYDALALPDGRLAAFVGDVEGRGLDAATTMAHVRAAVRTLVALDPDPRWVLEHLDEVFGALELPGLVTMVYVVVDPRSSEAEICSAGHLPAVKRSSTGEVSLVEAPGLLLGVDAASRSSTTVRFEPGDALVLYTDGLVERRGEHLDDSLERLTRYVHESPIDDPGSWVQALLDHHGSAVDDDVAALLLSRPRGAADRR